MIKTVKTNKKLKPLILGIASATLLLSTSFTFAYTNPLTSSQIAALSSAVSKEISSLNSSIKAMGNNMKQVALAKAAVTANENYQLNPFIPQYAPIDTSTGKTAGQLAQATTQNLTTQAVNNKLSYISEQLNSVINNTNSGASLSSPPSSETALTQLTTNLHASDTLWIQNTFDCQNNIAQSNAANKPCPNTIHNDSFDFQNFIGNPVYSDAQATDALNYIQFVSGNYLPLDDNQLSWSTLSNTLLGMSTSDRAPFLYKINTSSDFQNYQAGMRQILSIKSLVLSNLNYLFAQHQAQAGLGPAAGDPNATAASPLQVSNTIYNNTVNKPGWYKSIQTASPATLQRDTVVLLSYLAVKAHQESEVNARLLATMTILTSTSSMQLYSSLSQEAGKVNQLFANSSSDSSTTTTTVTNTDNSDSSNSSGS